MAVIVDNFVDNGDFFSEIALFYCKIDRNMVFGKIPAR